MRSGVGENWKTRLNLEIYVAGPSKPLLSPMFSPFQIRKGGVEPLHFSLNQIAIT
jgi:hypothetical protein